MLWSSKCLGFVFVWRRRAGEQTRGLPLVVTDAICASSAAPRALKCGFWPSAFSLHTNTSAQSSNLFSEAILLPLPLDATQCIWSAARPRKQDQFSPIQLHETASKWCFHSLGPNWKSHLARRLFQCVKVCCCFLIFSFSPQARPCGLEMRSSSVSFAPKMKGKQSAMSISRRNLANWKKECRNKTVLMMFSGNARLFSSSTTTRRKGR